MPLMYSSDLFQANRVNLYDTETGNYLGHITLSNKTGSLEELKQIHRQIEADHKQEHNPDQLTLF